MIKDYKDKENQSFEPYFYFLNGHNDVEIALLSLATGFDTGLQFNRMRYYSPILGRFNIKDPILSKNRYSYANNNPKKFFDPIGLYILPIPNKVYIVYNDLTHGPPIIIDPSKTPKIGPIIVGGICVAVIFLTSCAGDRDGDGKNGGDKYYTASGGKQISCSKASNCVNAGGQDDCLACCQWCYQNANWESAEYNACNKKCLE